MRIFLPVLTVWSKRTAYAALGINHAGLCSVHPEDIATPSLVRAASSHISNVRTERSVSVPSKGHPRGKTDPGDNVWHIEALRVVHQN
jgi:hypothetical protein